MADTMKCHLTLRVLTFFATLASTIVMATSNEKTTFQYFLIVQSVLTGYGFLLLFLPKKSDLWRLVIAMDLVMTVVLVSSVSSGWTIGYVGKEGNASKDWLPMCGDSVTKICFQVTGALLAGSVAVLAYVILILHFINTIVDPLFLR